MPEPDTSAASCVNQFATLRPRRRLTPIRHVRLRRNPPKTPLLGDTITDDDIATVVQRAVQVFLTGYANPPR
jgi:hypothetical protein